MGHPQHLVSTFGDMILPAVVKDEKRHGEKLIVANTGTLRFDLVSFSPPRPISLIQRWKVQWVRMISMVADQAVPRSFRSE